MKALEEYARATYGRSAQQLRPDQLKQIQDHVGPFVFGGPDKQGCREAAEIIDDCERLLKKLAPRTTWTKQHETRSSDHDLDLTTATKPS